jgi:hypothetical protein
MRPRRCPRRHRMPAPRRRRPRGRPGHPAQPHRLRQLPLRAMHEACQLIRDAAGNPDVQINFGLVPDDSLGDQVKVTVIATGFQREGLPEVEQLALPASVRTAVRSMPARAVPEPVEPEVVFHSVFDPPEEPEEPEPRSPNRSPASRSRSTTRNPTRSFSSRKWPNPNPKHGTPRPLARSCSTSTSNPSPHNPPPAPSQVRAPGPARFQPRSTMSSNSTISIPQPSSSAKGNSSSEPGLRSHRHHGPPRRSPARRLRHPARRQELPPQADGRRLCSPANPAASAMSPASSTSPLSAT